MTIEERNTMREQLFNFAGLKHMEGQIHTPRKIAKQMIDSLPESVWNSTTTFLDPATKSGVFLLEIYKKLMNSSDLQLRFPDPDDREQHILKNQLYGIATDELGEMFIRRMMYLDSDINNIVYLKDYVRRYYKGSWNLKEDLEKELGREVKFDVVIGNPPYQDESGKSSIYNSFVEEAIDLQSGIVCMITRDNWLNGKAFEKMRAKMIKNGAITDIIHYPIVGEVFEGVAVSVAYFLWKKNAESITKYTCIKNNKKVLTQELNLDTDMIYKSEMSKNIIEKLRYTQKWLEQFNTRSYPFMDQRKRYRLYEAGHEKSEYNNVKIISNNDADAYTNIHNFSNENEVLKYKVMCGVIINEASIQNPGNVLTNIITCGRNVVASETWSLIAVLESDMEAENCKQYIKSRFVRFVANQSVNGRSNVTDNTFKCVPMQDFTSASDIDWSQSVSDIDKQLYSKYSLSDDEIKYIESTIKPME